MRHAKSSWKSGVPTDHERPLNKRGRRAAAEIGALLDERNWRPDTILASDSTRTRETAERMHETLDGPTPVWIPDLYHGGWVEMAAALEALDRLEAAGDEEAPDNETVLILGHNPGCEEVVSRLSGQSVIMKTAYAALLEHPARHWSEATSDQPGTWQLRGLLTPTRQT